MNNNRNEMKHNSYKLGSFNDKVILLGMMWNFYNKYKDLGYNQIMPTYFFL